MAHSLLPVSGSPDELRFSHSHRAALVIGLVMAGVAVWHLVRADSTGQLVLGASVGLGALSLLRSAFYRCDLTLDLTARRWRRRRGPFFALLTDEGPLEDLEAVSLTVRYVQEGSGSQRRRVPYWGLALEFTGPLSNGPAVLLGLEQDETTAYRSLEEHARRLRVDAVDRTADEEARRSWNALDAPAAAAVTDAPPPPPRDSGIDTTLDSGRRRITLPAAGVTAWTVIACVFGLVFAGAGALGAAAALGLVESLPLAGDGGDAQVLVMAIVAGMFVLTGTSSIRSAVARSRAREWVVDEPDRLVFGATRSGRTWWRSEIPKSAVEEVTIRSHRDRVAGGHLTIMNVPIRAGPEAAARAAAVRVRTDHDIVRLGASLSPEAKAWLRDAILSMAREQAPAGH